MPFALHAQDVQVRSRFLSDTIRIGEKVPFAVTARYPRRVNILYPDSTYSYNPFELESKTYFATTTKDSLSYDSVVYYLTSYEVDSIQVFRMPVYVLQGSDCTAVFGAADSIRLKEYVDHVPDSVTAQQLPLKVNTSYLNVSWLFNYPIAIYVVAGLTVLLIVVWIIFGKRILKYFKLKRLTKAHADFLSKFGDALQLMQNESNAVRAESVLALWKRYMENLEDRPYSKYSSKEILYFLEDKNLAKALKTIDRMVYGGFTAEAEPFQELREVSMLHYNEKVRQVTNE